MLDHLPPEAFRWAPKPEPREALRATLREVIGTLRLHIAQLDLALLLNPEGEDVEELEVSRVDLHERYRRATARLRAIDARDEK